MVPAIHDEDGYNLGNWAGNQRTRKNRLSPEQCQRLDDLGFVWNVIDDKWENGYSALIKFYEREGHCLVPRGKTKKARELSRWVQHQREKSNKLSQSQRERLNAIGFVWDVLEYHFEQGFSSLKIFYEREGHCIVPQRYKENGFNLGNWVSTLRTRKENLNQDHVPMNL